MTRRREEKLMPAAQLVRELSEFQDKLLSYGHGHERVARWVNDAIQHIDSQLHNRIWPPVWWRYGTIDADASWLAQSFNRADSEGIFYAQTETGYLLEREEILERMDSIYKNYMTARRAAA